MTILVPDSKLLAICRSRKLAVREYGDPDGHKLIQRVCELMAADSMDDFRSVHASGVSVCSPPPSSTFLVRVRESLSLLLRPADTTVFNESTKSMDWTRIKEIELLKIAR